MEATDEKSNSNSLHKALIKINATKILRFSRYSDIRFKQD